MRRIFSLSNLAAAIIAMLATMFIMMLFDEEESQKVIKNEPVTLFSYTSSEFAYVGRGETNVIHRDEDFIFKVFEDAEMGRQIRFNISSADPRAEDYKWWSISFAVPVGEILTNGEYENARRWPFQEDDAPGLSFDGNGRGNNELSGKFIIRDIKFINGLLSEAAIDFVQYDEYEKMSWNYGAIRYNSGVPYSFDETLLGTRSDPIYFGPLRKY